jgi:hypothetical protein
MHPKEKTLVWVGIFIRFERVASCNSSKQWMKYDETRNNWPFPRSWACRSEPWFGFSSPPQSWMGFQAGRCSHDHEAIMEYHCVNNCHYNL